MISSTDNLGVAAKIVKIRNRLAASFRYKNMHLWKIKSLKGKELSVADHSDIYCLAKCNGLLFSGHWNGELVCWDLKKRNAVLIETYQKPVTCIEKAGKCLFVGSLDGSLRIYDSNSIDILKFAFFKT